MKSVNILLTFLGVLLVFCLAQPAGATLVQWKVEDGGNGHWYDLGHDGHRTKAGVMAWAESQYVNGEQGYLVTITSQEEQNFIVNYVLSQNPGRYYTGGKRWDDGDGVEPLGWSWDHGNGDAWGYTNWGSGQPSTSGGNDDLEIQADGTWSAIAGYITHSGGIVEFDAAVPVPASIFLLFFGLAGLAGLRRK